MAEQFASLTEDHISFIQRQHVFFVGTAGAEGRINVSPKGMDTLRVLDAGHVTWLNLTGSGNETAAHVAENSRMTIMFCSFERQPLILRLYGTANAIHPRDESFQERKQLFPEIAGTRQFFDMSIDMVQTSCGWAVPHYEMTGERQTLQKWATNKGDDGLAVHWQEKNQFSIDGKPTRILS